ncbi:MAG: HEAT repeat domain-containing protein [Bacteroidota bacterium]
MERDEAFALWQDKLNGEIGEEAERRLKAYLEHHPDEAMELQGLQKTWELFDQIERPEPSVQMDARFEGMMAAYQSSKKRVSPISFTMEWMVKSWRVALAFLVIGLLVGWWMLPSHQQSNSISELSNEIQSMKELMMLTLIEQPKAQERIRAVNMTSDLPNADEKVIKALISTLNLDENLNVRLAALESLTQYADRPMVRMALIEALTIQNSPILLVAIADVLVLIQETSSVEAMKMLREKTDEELVKDKLEESIASLISS